MPSRRAARGGRSRRRRLLGTLFGDLADDDLAVERKYLKDQIEPAAILVREHKTDVEPVVILAFAPDDRVGTVRRLPRLFSLRHWSTPFELVAVSCAGGHRGRIPGVYLRGS